MLLFILTFLTHFISYSQEIISIKADEITYGKSETDKDLEFQFALGNIQQKDICTKFQNNLSKNTFGCWKVESLKQAKEIWEKNEENSDWEALSLLDEKAVGFDAATQFVDSVMEDVLGSVKIENGKMSFGKSSPAETTGRLIFACSQLTDCLKRTLTVEERAAIVEFLLSVKPITSGVALGLKAFSDFGMSSVVFSQNGKNAKVSVTNLLGKRISWSLGKNSSKDITKQGEDGISVTGSSTSPSIPVEIVVGKASIVFSMKFEATATFGNAIVTLKEKNSIKAEEEMKFSEPIKYSQTIEPGQSVEISLTAFLGSEAFCPEQATFALISENSKIQTQASATCSSKDGIKIVITNNLKLAEELKFQSGKYSLIFISSDERMGNPTLWKMGFLQLSLSPVPAKKHLPLFTHSLLHESDSTLTPLQEIHHQFREPDRRAHPVLSLIFTGIHGALLVGLFLMLILNGFSVLDILKNVRVLAFAVVLSGIEGILIWYWIAPSGAPTMESLAYKYIPPIALVLYFVSRNLFGEVSKKKHASM